MKTRAIIDIGTNSIKFCVANCNNDGTITPIIDQFHTTRIGQNFYQTGRISSEAIQRNIKKINELKEQADQYGASEIIAIGTMIFRNAENTGDFQKQVKSSCGIDIHVLSGDDEARLSYQAALSSFRQMRGHIAVFDTGGGSTEITFGNDQNIYHKVSLNIGAVTGTEKFFPDDPIVPSQTDQFNQFVDKHLESLSLKSPIDSLIGSSGIVTTMAAIQFRMATYDPNIVHGTVLTQADIREQINQYSQQTIAQKKEITGMQKGRADIILAGACIVDRIMSRLQCNQLVVCDRGMRYALIENNALFTTEKSVIDHF